MNTSTSRNERDPNLAAVWSGSDASLDWGSGSLVLLDNLHLGQIFGVSRVYAHVAVDAASGIAFVRVAGTKQARVPILLLQEVVLPDFVARGTQLDSVVTDRGREYVGGARHPLDRFLDVHGIRHVVADSFWVSLHPAFDRFTHEFRRAFGQGCLWRGRHHNLEPIAADLAAWLLTYNAAQSSSQRKAAPGA